MKRFFRFLKDSNSKKSDKKFLLSSDDIKRIEKVLGVSFHNKDLLIQSLKHRSILNVTSENRLQSNERLEFLGDAVVNLAVTHFLYDEYPSTEEGILSKRKAILVSREVLAEVAKELNMGEFVFLTKGEEKTGGRKRISILSNVYEAVVGAIYLDQGYTEAEKFVYRTVLKNHNKFIESEEYTNFKSKLLEYAQKNQLGLPEYRVVKEEGPDHNKTFYVDVLIAHKKVGTGVGKSKKQAEQNAASEAIKKLQTNKNFSF